ncbi:hypothetical protein HU200_058839 [Digitaria exilis]|uniref:Phosphatidic acid phosphatase type 2/haloperoxidase domain-containing protein n=1 Tax=Digitaria exilis TaxID=1010633 RepID=A0A835AMA6_9POAL|nr:hypothetical protein HU200_058839 [Digitaria exilis]
MPPPPQVVVATAHPGPPRFYLKTDGTRVARLHLLDWVVLVVLVAVDVALNAIEPFHRFVGQDMVPDLRYPLKNNTVPVWAVPVRSCVFIHKVVAVVMPMAIVAGIYVRRRNVYDLHHAILGKFLSRAASHFHISILEHLAAMCPVVVVLVIVKLLTVSVPKVPNFRVQTLFDLFRGSEQALSLKNSLNAMSLSSIRGAFAGLGFLSWYLAGKIKAFDRGGHVAKLCIVAMPLLLAAMVAVSRVDDYWHHWQDVFTAGVLGTCFSSPLSSGSEDRTVSQSRSARWYSSPAGLVVASFCYLQFFPPPSGEQGMLLHFVLLALRCTVTSSRRTYRL